MDKLKAVDKIEIAPEASEGKQVKRSVTDPDARFLRSRSGFVLGYTGEIAVSEDHLIVAARVTQNAHDVHALVPMTEVVERNCRRRLRCIVADSGFYSNANVKQLEQRGIQTYIPDSNMARELNVGSKAEDDPRFEPVQKKMRRKLRSHKGQAVYARRKAIVEPVFGVIKEQRNLRSFRLRGIDKVNTEFLLAALAYNITRLFRRR